MIEMNLSNRMKREMAMLARDRIKRETKPPDRYRYANLIAFSLIARNEVLEDEPTSLKAVLASEEKDKWKTTMEEEMKSIYDKNTWEFIKKPIGSRVVN